MPSRRRRGCRWSITITTTAIGITAVGIVTISAGAITTDGMPELIVSAGWPFGVGYFAAPPPVPAPPDAGALATPAIASRRAWATAATYGAHQEHACPAAPCFGAVRPTAFAGACVLAAHPAFAHAVAGACILPAHVDHGTVLAFRTKRRSRPSNISAATPTKMPDRRVSTILASSTTRRSRPISGSASVTAGMSSGRRTPRLRPDSRISSWQASTRLM